MDSEMRRKRKQITNKLLPLKFLVFCCCSLFVLILYVSLDRLSVPSSELHPPLAYPADVSLLTSAVSLVKDSDEEEVSTMRVLFPDHVMFLIPSTSHLAEASHCVYHPVVNDSLKEIVVKPVLSMDIYDELRSIIRCPLPLVGHSGEVDLWKNEIKMVENDRDNGHSWRVHSWKMLAYEAILDGDNVIVFVKGLNLRQGRVSDSTHISCRFGLGELDKNETFFVTTKAISAAQEMVRCGLPPSFRNNIETAHGLRVAIVVDHIYHGRIMNQTVLPSVAAISKSLGKTKQVKAKYEMCVCTMVWNQALALPEWVMYHSWLGVQRWFIYDNNSDDEIQQVIAELEENGYHVSRHTWPWIKTQEAGFSHCAVRAKDECKWVVFFDVDEFFYFPTQSQTHRPRRVHPGKNSLRNLVSSFSSSKTIGELRTSCHSFGPSGLRILPSKGITTGYTCRLQSPERHKSIVRLDALHTSLLNVVHHFHLKKEFRYINVLQSKSLINHYKYQVWDVFKAKFYRRVATYVADWHENQNEGSKDRTPGLGTEAVEPPNWHLQFCEIWDTGLRDMVLAKLADPMTGDLPWEKLHISHTELHVQS